MIGHRYTIICIAVLCVAVCPAREALAQSAGDLVEKGNQSFREGNYDDALADYEKASVEAPESPYIYFNKGAASYKKGDYKKAAEFFKKAAIKTKSIDLEARSAYNQGNCSFRESERQRDSDLKKSLNVLKDAIDHYQQALKLSPGLTDAAHNIEVSRLVMKQILDKIKKQQEEAKKKQQKQQKQADKLKDLIKRQEKLATQTKTLGKKNPPDLQAQANKLAAEQKNLKSETEKLAKQLTPPQGKPDPSSAKPAEHLKSALKQQSAAAENLEPANPDQAHQHQEKALKEMKEAQKQMSGTSSGTQDKQQKKKSGKSKQENKSGARPGGQPKDTQAPRPRNETAHEILKQEKADRERRSPTVHGGYSPVDKDW